MNITVVPGRRLTPESMRAWLDLQVSDPAWWSPFLSPLFTTAVAAVRDDVQVGIIEEHGAPVGFFPFQHGRFSIGRPVGGWLNETQAVVVQPGVAWNPVELVRRCGLHAWHFSRLLGSQTAFGAFHARRRVAAVIDLSQGYAAYAAARRRSGSREVQKLEALARRLEREVGPLRFEAHSGDPRLLRLLMEWKLQRYGRRGYLDLYAIPWVRRLFETIQQTQTPDFAGLLSVLSAGAEVVALHMGLRSQRAWHYWQPAYNPAFARYSPGAILLLKIAQHAPVMGLQRLDLSGSDEYPYKQRLMNSSCVLLEGTVGCAPVITAAGKWCQVGGDWIRRSPYLHRPARTVLRALRRSRHAALSHDR